MMKSNFEIKINKEIRDYTESIFFGLSLRQSIFSIIACGIACGIFFLLNDKLGTEITSWLCMLGAAPFAAFGFIRFQGMYTEDIVKTVFNSLLLSSRDLINKPFNLYNEVFEPMIKQSRKESIVHDKKLRKIEKAEQRKNKSA
ncbi:PrgI family protein [Holdemanella porci]|uniref:PrgI family protein n=1 Tax=Holdemanella porci TaxID=2652276 RepID=UPI003AB4982E|nr:PrgI family protein [Holdemanella sp. SCCA2]